MDVLNIFNSLSCPLLKNTLLHCSSLCSSMAQCSDEVLSAPLTGRSPCWMWEFRPIPSKPQCYSLSSFCCMNCLIVITPFFLITSERKTSGTKIWGLWRRVFCSLPEDKSHPSGSSTLGRVTKAGRA